MANIINEIVNKKRCSGCLGCVNICDKNAISFDISSEGFYRPIIDYKICSNCSKCYSFCTTAKSKKGTATLKFFSAQANDGEALSVATSGGFFQEIGRYFIQNGGVVYGAVYDKNMNIVISRTTNIIDLRAMSGSKYAQSNALNSYVQVLTDLKNGKRILYSALPCQIAALLTFLNFKNCDYTNLVTIDFPCYGITPIKFFKENIDSFSKQTGGVVFDFRFRDKTKNGFSHTTLIKVKKNDDIVNYTYDNFKDIPCHYAFAQKNFFQANCYCCEFIKKTRVSDFTIGSFWNPKLIDKIYDTSKGVSMICLNTTKAIWLFEQIKDQFICSKHSAEEIYNFNAGLYKHEYKFNREKIFKYYVKHGYLKTSAKFFRHNEKKEKMQLMKRKIFQKLDGVFKSKNLIDKL